mmetsp:Transcript_6297/g.12595  ORF Transcript_6297/g.12595 Transcript_6297/m.12595 type:complete len:464 (+) Transcript_6297:38-1429(+)
MSTNNTVVTQDTSTVHTVAVVSTANEAIVAASSSGSRMKPKKNDSEEASSSSNSNSSDSNNTNTNTNNSLFFRYCLQPCRETVFPMCVKFVLGLTLALVAGMVEALLAICIFLRSRHMHGTVGTYGSAIPAIAIIILSMFMAYTVFLYLTYRWKKVQQQQQQQQERRQTVNNKHKGDEEEEHDQDEERGQVCKQKIDWEVPSSSASASASSSASVATRQDTIPSWGVFARRRRRRLCIRILLPLSFILFMGTEVALVLNIPRNAILPLIPPFAQDALLDDAVYRPSTCDLANRWDKATSFFRNNTALDSNKVKLVYGGMTFSKNSLASEFDNTIYFWKYSCPSEETLVHELTHVVQEQTGYWSGVGAPRRAMEMVLTPCKSCLYDYGTYDDLQAKMELAMATGDPRVANVYQAFNAEQVAEIVEDYYTEYDRCQASLVASETDSSLWYCDALRYYATQVTGGD